MQRFKHVAVIGIDGMGGFNKSALTPCMDRIFAIGAVTYRALSMDPTISAENWGGMLIGCDPAVHRLTNGYISTHPYINDIYPSLFKIIRLAFPDAYLASVVNWNPINIGIVEDGFGVDKRTASDDESVTAQVIDCIRNKPVFLFVQLDEVDGAGHHYGYGTPEYFSKITEIDGMVGRMYDAYRAAGIIEDTLFICIADHGGINHSHGGWSETEKRIFFAASGKGIIKGEPVFTVTKDISAIVLYALGLDIPEYNINGYSSQVPQGLFSDYDKPYIIPESSALPEFMPSKNFFSSDGLDKLFPARIPLCMFMDNSLSDETGKCTISETGRIKFYSNGVRGAAAEFGKTGYFTVGGFDFGSSFTVSLWLLADPGIEDCVCILGNKSPESGKHQEKGFNILLRNHSVMIQLGCGDDDTDSVTSFDIDGYSGWVNIIVSFDFKNLELTTVVNFDRKHVDSADKKYFDSLSGSGELTVGEDIYGQFNSKRNLIFRMDDLIIFDGNFTENDLDIIKKYYNL